MGQLNINFIEESKSSLFSYKNLMPLNIQRFSGTLSIQNVYETRVDIASNSSYVHADLVLSVSSGTYNNTGNAYFYLNASSSNNSYGTGNVNFKISAGATKTLWSGELGPFYHNSDGGLGAVSLSAYAYVVSNTQPTASASCGMSTIPRYATITSLYTSNVAGYHGVHALNVNWATDTAVDWLQYSLNDGNWADAGGNTFTIWNLAPNTQYRVRIRVKRTDSQLWTESGYVYGTTKQINYITSGNPNITNGQTLRVTATNPSGANCQIILEVPAGTRRIIKSGTDVTFSVDEVNSMMQYIAGTTSTIRVTADTLDDNGNIAYSSWNDGIYTLVDSNPTFNNFVFEDINEKTLALTGNNQDCIVGFSNIKATISIANKAIAQNYATMSKYRLTIGDKTTDVNYSDTEDVSLTINNASNGTYTMYAIDSRNISTPVTLLANKVINYTKLIKTSVGTAIRVNDSGENTGVDEKVKISFTGQMWSGNFGIKDNSIIDVKYKYKISDSAEYITGETPIKIQTNSDGTFSFEGLIKGDTDEGFDISNSYVIEVIVNDELSSIIYTMQIGSGRPHLAYSKNGLCVMGKYDENEGGLFQIGGKRIDGTILYEDSTGSNQTITLKDKADNYSVIEIFYKEITNNTLNSIRIVPIDGFYFNLLNSYPIAGEIAYFYSARLRIVDNQFQVLDNCYNRMTLKADANDIAHNIINDNYITKVIGYKY